MKAAQDISVAGRLQFLSQHFEEENVEKCWPELYNAMLRHGLPDIYYAGQFQLEVRRVVGIGRDKEHRKHAACLGMAMVCACRDPIGFVHS